MASLAHHAVRSRNQSRDVKGTNHTNFEMEEVNTATSVSFFICPAIASGRFHKWADEAGGHTPANSARQLVAGSNPEF
jgi:hypothetical protein